ncbi:MAG: hypothetical protein H6686_06805 [Fibrobacteria bacterium]|nr:hypothetical protein [Fibrobacteria bacterium]
MAKKPQLVVGLELGEDTCKLVAFHPDHRRIEFVGLTWVEPAWRESSEALGKGLSTWLADLKLDKGIKAASVCVSGVSSMLTLAELDPNLPLDQSATFEACQWLGKAENEFHVNALPHGTGPMGEPAHLLVAHRKETIQRVRSVAEAAGLPLAEVGVDAIAALNAFEINYSTWTDRLVAVVLASSRNLQIVWTKNGQFLGHGVVVLSSGEGADQIALEGGKALQAGLGLQGASPDHLEGVFLAGDLAAEAGFAPRLGNGTKFEIRLLDAFSAISFPSAEGMLGQLAETAPKCAVALGLAVALSEGERA